MHGILKILETLFIFLLSLTYFQTLVVSISNHELLHRHKRQNWQQFLPFLNTTIPVRNVTYIKPRWWLAIPPSVSGTFVLGSHGRSTQVLTIGNAQGLSATNRLYSQGIPLMNMIGTYSTRTGGLQSQGVPLVDMIGNRVINSYTVNTIMPRVADLQYKGITLSNLVGNRIARIRPQDIAFGTMAGSYNRPRMNRVYTPLIGGMIGTRIAKQNNQLSYTENNNVNKAVTSNNLSKSLENTIVLNILQEIVQTNNKIPLSRDQLNLLVPLLQTMTAAKLQA